MQTTLPPFGRGPRRPAPGPDAGRGSKLLFWLTAVLTLALGLAIALLLLLAAIPVALLAVTYVALKRLWRRLTGWTRDTKQRVTGHDEEGRRNVRVIERDRT